MKLEDALDECPVVAILRGVKPTEVLEITEALYDAGVRGVEIPLNSPDPLKSLELLSRTWGDRMICGAGTVLNPAAVDAVAEAGARLIVAPNTVPAVIRRALELGIEPVPGFVTPTEAFAALGAGARHLKLFPAVTLGPAYLRQLMAVLPPEGVVWAVGGAGADQMSEWWGAGARAFGIGSELYRPGQTAVATAQTARRVVEAARGLRT